MMKKDKTSYWQLLSCSTGNVINDLCSQVYLVYLLIFLVKVAGLSGKEAGFILLLSQIADGFIGPIVGYCSDNITIPLLARCLGRRKAWQFIGTVIMVMLFPLMYTRCLICSDSSPHWVKVAYYAAIMVVIDVGYSTVNIGHLSVISVVTKNENECIVANTLRILLTYLSGICAFAVTWAILGNSSEDGLSPSSWIHFTVINCILTGIGLLFSGLIFHIGTKEPKEKITSVFRDLITKTGLLSVAMIFTLGTNVEEQAEPLDSVTGRKVSVPLHKISATLIPFDQSLATFSKEGARSDATVVQRKPTATRKLSTLRKVSALMVPFEVRGEHVEVYDNSGVQDDSDTKRNERRKLSEKERKKSVYIGLGYGKMTSVTICEYEDEDEDEEMIGQVNDNFEQDELDVETDNIDTNQRDIRRKSVFANKMVDDCHDPERNCERELRTRKQWLKDPKLYVVAVIYALTRLLLDAAYCYTAFYLTDNLLFPTEAIAYFPLILLASGACGTAISKILDRRLGHKRTYCVNAMVVVGCAVWFYFLTPSTRSQAYAPALLMGSSMSAMFVMALFFITRLIGDNKETAGFVFSVTVLTGRIISGTFFMTVQSFAPDSGEGGTFARLVFTMSTGMLALLGSIIVVIFQKSERSNTSGSRKRKIAVQETRSEFVSEVQELSFPPITFDTRL